MSQRTFRAKGIINFVCTASGPVSIRYGKEYYENKVNKEYADLAEQARHLILEDMYESLKYRAYSLIDGRAFVEGLLHGCFTNEDGEITDIFVDDLKSNLGVVASRIDRNCKSSVHPEVLQSGGKFYVDVDMLDKLTRTHDVLINWKASK